MRRLIAMIALLAALGSGLGCCHHIAGKNDCGWNPSDYPIGPPSPPYPVAPPPPVPETKAPEQIPRSITNSVGSTASPAGGDISNLKPIESPFAPTAGGPN